MQTIFSRCYLNCCLRILQGAGGVSHTPTIIHIEFIIEDNNDQFINYITNKTLMVGQKQTPEHTTCDIRCLGGIKIPLLTSHTGMNPIW